MVVVEIDGCESLSIYQSLTSHEARGREKEEEGEYHV